MTLAYNEPGQQAAQKPLTGRVLEGRYALGLPLGSGGMGTVYAARQIRLDREVAIKVLHPDFVRNSEAAARFLREAKLLSRIRHPNVIQLLDYGETEDKLLYCVMELLVGSDLEQLQARMPHGRMPWPGACDLLAQIADGLGAVHRKDIVHRDVKPSYCFVSFEADNEPIVKLLDFGVARASRGDTGPALTQAGLLIGTPSHIAPELLRTKHPATPISDIYSLGVVAYRLLSGRLPFFGDTMFSQMQAACFDEPDPLDDPDQDVPIELQKFVLKLLDKDPAKRPSDARAVAERFRVVAGRGTPSPLPFEFTRGDEGSDPLVENTALAAPLPDLRTPSPRLDPTPDPTLPTALSSQDSIEEFDLDEILVVPPPWHADRRLWLVAALLLGVLGLTLLVALSDDPARPSPAPQAKPEVGTGSAMLGRSRPG